MLDSFAAILPSFFPPLLADFGSWGMLWFASAASAPILIHLWNRRRFREVQWAAMRYLLAALRKNSRRIRIEQLILLLLRVAVLLLLALALAEPFFGTMGMSPAAGRRTHRVLVLDASFSMAYRPADKSLWQRARELATQIVQESNQGDGFTLVLMGSPPRVVVGTPVFDHQDFIGEIDALRLPHAGGDLVATLDKVSEVLASARREHPKLERSEVYIITDLGRASWSPESPAAKAEFRRRGRQLADVAALTLLDLGQQDSGNVAVTGLEMSDTYATTMQDVNFQADVARFGPQPAAQYLVEFFVDDRPAGEAYVDLPEGVDRSSVSFNYRFDTPGEHVAEARLSSDALDVDNSRFVSVPVKRQLRVLCVNGRPAGKFGEGATDYLMAALGGGDAGRSAIRAEVAGERAISEQPLGAYDAVFLCNVGQFTEAEAQLLYDYAAQGGGLVFFLGDRVRADSYNERLADDGSGRPYVLPARIGKLQSFDLGQNQYVFDPLEYRHQIVKAFKNNEQVGFLSTPVYRYMQLVVPEESTARVALAFSNGDPMIVEQQIGRGRSILLATSASDPSNAKDPWSDLPALPNFVPLVRQLLAAAVVGQFEKRNLQVGDALGGVLPLSAADVRLSVSTPWGDSEQVRVRPEGDGAVWAYTGTDQRGVYAVEFPGPNQRQQRFAVNVDTRESDLARLELDELRNEIWQSVPFRHSTEWQNLDEPTTQEITSRESWSSRLLWTMVGLLMTETFLAWLFGRHGS